MFILSQLSGISHHYKQKYTTGKKKKKKESFLAKITLHLLVYIDMRSLTHFIPINFKNNFWNNQNSYIFLKIKLSFDNLLQMCIHIQCTILDCNILRYSCTNSNVITLISSSTTASWNLQHSKVCLVLIIATSYNNVFSN